MYTSTSQNFNLDKFNEIIEQLKPNKIIFTSDEDLYNELMKLPYINDECLQLSAWLEGTYVVDMVKMREISKKPFMIQPMP